LQQSGDELETDKEGDEEHNEYDEADAPMFLVGVEDYRATFACVHNPDSSTVQTCRQASIGIMPIRLPDQDV
jgi:hypothetical protein